VTVRARVVVLVVALVVALSVTAGCTSPEATRLRAGGQGADVGNRGPVQLHSGSDPFYRTPTRGATLVPRPVGTEVAASAKTR
jgi:hypothetical protein